jgi:hypothetical protein
MASFFEQLTTLDSIQALIDEGARESEVLEYKTASTGFSEKEKAELVKDISGMANSLGGTIIYGVATDERDKTLPRRIVPIEVKNIETLDRVLNAQVRPPIDGLRRRLIPELNPQVLIIDVPESQNPPHQSLYDKRYYRRSGIECLPMEHDLIALKFGRRLSPVLDLIAKSESAPGAYEGDPPWTIPAKVRLFIANSGRRVGRDVQGILKFPPAHVLRIRAFRLQRLDELYNDIQVRQLDGDGVFHPGMNTSVEELTLSFPRNSVTPIADSPLIEWTLYADEMEMRTGVVTLASLGWSLPE